MPEIVDDYSVLKELRKLRVVKIFLGNVAQRTKTPQTSIYLSVLVFY